MTESITAPRLSSRLVNGLLAIKPLAKVAKQQARRLMINRAEAMGVPWRSQVQQLQNRGEDYWAKQLAAVQNPALSYPDYYLRPFHAYDGGNLGWEPALEVEVAAHAVHATIWSKAQPDPGGDGRLRQSYHQVLQAKVNPAPQVIVDLGCSVGMSTVALHHCYPQAQITGVDLSPYFLAVAHDRYSESYPQIRWLHAPAEATGLPSGSVELVSLCLVFHELPRSAAQAILQEAHRLLRPGGWLGLMDMNPQSQVHRKMPPYVLTLLKSTEPYLDDYFTFDIAAAIAAAGFRAPEQVNNSPRHRTLVAQRP